MLVTTSASRRACRAAAHSAARCGSEAPSSTVSARMSGPPGAGRFSSVGCMMALAGTMPCRHAALRAMAGNTMAKSGMYPRGCRVDMADSPGWRRESYPPFLYELLLCGCFRGFAGLMGPEGGAPRAVRGSPADWRGPPGFPGSGSGLSAANRPPRRPGHARRVERVAEGGHRGHQLIERGELLVEGRARLLQRGSFRRRSRAPYVWFMPPAVPRRWHRTDKSARPGRGVSGWMRKSSTVGGSSGVAGGEPVTIRYWCGHAASRASPEDRYPSQWGLQSGKPTSNNPRALPHTSYGLDRLA